MKKLRLLLLALLVAGIVFWLAGKVGGPPDPQYQGRRLSEVLKNFMAPFQPYILESGRAVLFWHTDVKAIRHMGTNAIPYLLREMTARDSVLKLKIRELVANQFSVSIPITTSEYRQERAVEVFKVLGADGEPAIPELARLLSDRGAGDSAAKALAAIGGKSMPILIQALTHSNEIVRSHAAAGLGETRGEQSQSVVPALIQSLGDNEWWVRRCAVDALGKIHQEPALAVPALMKCLEDSNHSVRMDAVRALRKFGAEAKPAIPTLLKTRESSEIPSDYMSVYWIERAIKAIDPEVAARAGIR